MAVTTRQLFNAYRKELRRLYGDDCADGCRLKEERLNNETIIHISIPPMTKPMQYPKGRFTEMLRELQSRPALDFSRQNNRPNSDALVSRTNPNRGRKYGKHKYEQHTPSRTSV